MTELEDLVEIDSLILDLEGRDYVLSVDADETLKKECSQDWEAFKYLQERLHDVRISEPGRNKMHEITMHKDEGRSESNARHSVTFLLRFRSALDVDVRQLSCWYIRGEGENFFLI